VIDYTSIDLKLERANEHLHAFENELRAYVQSNPISLVAQPRDDPLREPFNINLREPIPDRLSLIYGDFIHNVRSTLDHLVMVLALDNGADPYDSSIQFPICDHPDRFFGEPGKKTGTRPTIPPRGTGGYQVRTLRPPEQAFVEGLQPYRRQGMSWVLTELQNLDNMDKHRNVIEHNIEASVLWGPPLGVQIEWASRLRLVDGTYVATVVYPPNYTGVQVKPVFTAGISVERSNRIGFLDAHSFGRNDLIPHIRTQIVAEAKRLFP